MKCLSYSQRSAILCFFIFCFYTFYLILEKCQQIWENLVFLVIFDTCVVLYNWSISLLPPIVLDNLFVYIVKSCAICIFCTNNFSIYEKSWITYLTSKGLKIKFHFYPHPYIYFHIFLNIKRTFPISNDSFEWMFFNSVFLFFVLCPCMALFDGLSI